MNGTQELNMEYINKIKCIIDKAPICIKSYSSYLGTNVSYSTKYSYVKHAYNFVSSLNKNISDVNIDDFLLYLSSMEYKTEGKETTSSYRILVYSALKRFCKYLYVSKRINDNYMEYVDRPMSKESQYTKSKREKGFLESNEIRQMISNVGNDNEHYNKSEFIKIRDITIIKLFLNTGMRCSALRRLDIGDIDFINNRIIVTDKGSHVKQYDISQTMMNELKQWIDIRQKYLMNCSVVALFISNRKQRIDGSSIYKLIKKYGKCIKDKNITPHKLRATYGTMLYNSTNDIYFVQKCMGHANPKTTELYIRGVNDNLKRAANIMEEIINES